ncbi:MAG: DUF6922 domain-containing protein [Bacillota bacterium]
MKLPAEVALYFWDVSLDNIDLDKHRKFIITRILNEGDHLAVAWLFNTYDKEIIKKTVISARNLSVKTARCWQNYFGLKEEELCCTGLYLAKNEKPF